MRPDKTLVISGEDFESSAVLEIAKQNRKWLTVKPLQIGKQSLKAVIPPEFKFGTWRGIYRERAGNVKVEVFNGSAWADAGFCTLSVPAVDRRPVINLEEHPSADPTGKHDSTFAFVQMMERASCIPGGAIIQVPRGHFRIDAILRPKTFMPSQLSVMENVSLRGAGANQTLLWFTTQKTALPCLIECANNSEIRDMAIYA